MLFMHPRKSRRRDALIAMQQLFSSAAARGISNVNEKMTINTNFDSVVKNTPSSSNQTLFENDENNVATVEKNTSIQSESSRPNIETG